MPRFGLLIASRLLAAGAVGVSAGTLTAAKATTRSAPSADEPAAPSACQASLVRYEWNRRAGGAPWISTRAGRSRLEGYLYAYHEYLGDGRVNRSERVVLRAGKPEKIAWFSTVWGGRRLIVTGKRLDERGSFSQRFFAAVSPSGFYPSGIRIPVAADAADGGLAVPHHRGGGRSRTKGHVRSDARARVGMGRAGARAFRNLCWLELENRGGRRPPLRRRANA